MKTFENLQFNQKRDYNGQFTSGKRAYLRIDRHFAVSVLLGGEDCYTNGIDTYEMAILYNDEVLNDIGQNDVYAYISKEKVNDVLIHLQSLTETESMDRKPGSVRAGRRGDCGSDQSAVASSFRTHESSPAGDYSSLPISGLCCRLCDVTLCTETCQDKR